MSQTNPLLASLVLPGRIFQLPSRGLFYKDGELSPEIKDGEIHVRAMSALDDIHMKNPDQLFSGDAIKTVFSHCVEGVLKPDQLLTRDVDAIMVFLRTVTYGPDFEFMAKHICTGAKDHSYTANVDKIIQDSVLIDPTTVDDLFTYTLPNNQVIHFNPPRYGKLIDILKFNKNKETLSIDELKENNLSMLMSTIYKVDDVSDPVFIKEWASRLPPTWVNAINEKLSHAPDWGPSMKWNVVCKDCGEPYTIDIPLNPITFFTE